MLGSCSVSVVGTGGVSLPPVNGSGDVEVQTPVGKQRTCASRDEIMGFYADVIVRTCMASKSESIHQFKH